MSSNIDKELDCNSKKKTMRKKMKKYKQKFDQLKNANKISIISIATYFHLAIFIFECKEHISFITIYLSLFQ